MTKTEITATTTGIRRCKGSERFGIEAHDAPIADFPKQPSRKDGLGTMCSEHWKAYVKGLTADRKAREASEAFASAPTAAAAVEQAAAKKPKRKAAAKKPTNGDAVAQAQALIAEVEALPAPESSARWGDDDVQAALELVGSASVGASHETPLGDTIDASATDEEA